MDKDIHDNDKAPEILYKYFPPTFPSGGLVPYFEVSNTIRFTQPSVLNDVYECLPSFENADFTKGLKTTTNTSREMDEILNNKSLQAYGKKIPYPKRRRIKAQGKAKLKRKIRNDPETEEEHWVKKFPDFLDGSLGILSMTKLWNSAAMWGYYAQNCTGFVLGFKSRHAAVNIYPMAQVSYKAKRHLYKGGPIYEDTPENQQQLMDIIKRKNKSWKHEKEWRLFTAPGALMDTGVKMGPEKLPILVATFPFDSLAEVVLGIKMEPIIKSKILEQLPPDIPAYQAKINPRSYDLDREIIER